MKQRSLHIPLKKLRWSVYASLSMALLSSCLHGIAEPQQAFEVLPTNTYKKLRPVPQYFYFDPSEPYIIQGQKGSQINIPANAFTLPGEYKDKDQIKFIIHEARSSSDLLGAGLNLDDGQEILQSSGMVRMAAFYNNRRIKLKKKLQLSVPSNNDPRDYNVYNYKNGQWNLHGHNQESIVECEGCEDSRMRRRIYSAIDSLTWWNFDYPKPGIICLRTIVNGPSNHLNHISVVGMDYAGTFSRWYKGNQIEINAPANSRVKLLVANNEDAIAFSETIQTWDRPGFMFSKKKEHSCQSVAALKFRKFSADELTRENFSRIVGLK